jgi:hypothetical protein
LYYLFLFITPFIAFNALSLVMGDFFILKPIASVIAGGVGINPSSAKPSVPNDPSGVCSQQKRDNLAIRIN